MTTCENTMIAQHGTRRDMPAAIGYVKVGVVRLMLRQ